MAVHNLSPEPCTVPLRLDGCESGCLLVDLLQEGVTEVDPQGRTEVVLDGYGYRWLRVVPRGSRRLA